MTTGIVRIEKSRKLRWVENVARMRDKRRAYRIVVRKFLEQLPHGRRGDREITAK
jgi:hypothetical protein